VDMVADLGCAFGLAEVGVHAYGYYCFVES
jgi:hypothetical protein